MTQLIKHKFGVSQNDLKNLDNKKKTQQTGLKNNKTDLASHGDMRNKERKKIVLWQVAAKKR